MRFMMLYKPGKESDGPPSEREMAAVGQLIQEMAKAGILVATDGLQPSSKGSKVRISGEKFIITDGPFIETKEVIGGYAIVNVGSKQEAIELAKRFLTVMGEGESEVRQMYDTPAGPGGGCASMESSAMGGKKDLVFSRVFKASVDRVWKAWTDPEQVKRWWGPTGFTCPLARIDLREGGKSLVCMRAPKEFGGQDMYSTWTYTKITPRSELGYFHHFADKDGNRVEPAALGLPPDMPSEVRNLVTFKAVGADKTLLTVVEFDWPSAA